MPEIIVPGRRVPYAGFQIGFASPANECALSAAAAAAAARPTQSRLECSDRIAVYAYRQPGIPPPDWLAALDYRTVTPKTLWATSQKRRSRKSGAPVAYADASSDPLRQCILSGK
jgi:hypothetical protein